MNVDSSSILLRSSDFYQQHGIEMWTQKEVRGKGHKLSVMSSNLFEQKLSLVFVKKCVFFILQVVSVNPADKTVRLGDGTVQHYDQLLISTGCRLESSQSCSSSLLETVGDRNIDFPSGVTFLIVFAERGRSAVLGGTCREWTCCRILKTPKRFTAPVLGERLSSSEPPS